MSQVTRLDLIEIQPTFDYESDSKFRNYWLYITPEYLERSCVVLVLCWWHQYICVLHFWVMVLSIKASNAIILFTSQPIAIGASIYAVPQPPHESWGGATIRQGLVYVGGWKRGNQYWGSKSWGTCTNRRHHHFPRHVFTPKVVNGLSSCASIKSYV